MNSFELGPIRPPSEAFSILLRVTRNCPWNKCAFCITYKGQKFSKRPLEQIISDIDAIYNISIKIKDNIKNNKITNETLLKAKGDDTISLELYQQVAFWMQFGMESVFLQDANSLLLPTEDLCKILSHIKKRFPQVKRITTYARASTLYRKSLDELKLLKEHGLTRLHVGMESGSDNILKLINKGITQIQLIEGGKKAIEAGFDLSYYYMPGIGGKDLTIENAIESAKVINEVNPTFIRIRSTVPIPQTPLYQMMQNKTWQPLTEIEKVIEIKNFIENCNNITSHLLSDHIMNLLEDVEGKFPDDKQKMLNIIDSFLNMNEEDRDKFIIGRRIGMYRYLKDFIPNIKIDQLYYTIKQRYDSIDDAMLEILANYI